MNFLKSLPPYHHSKDDLVLCYSLDTNAYYIIMGLPSEEVWEKVAGQVFPIPSPHRLVGSFPAFSYGVHLYAGSGHLCDGVLYETHLIKGPFFVTNTTKDMTIPIYDEAGEATGETTATVKSLPLSPPLFTYGTSEVGQDFWDSFLEAAREYEAAYKDLAEAPVEDCQCDELDSDDEEEECEGCMFQGVAKSDHADAVDILAKARAASDEASYHEVLKASQYLDSGQRAMFYSYIPEAMMRKYDMRDNFTRVLAPSLASSLDIAKIKREYIHD